MRPRKNPSVVFVTILAALALALLIELENVVPADWARTHDMIHALMVLMPLQPILAWRHKQKLSNPDTTRGVPHLS